LQGSVIEITIVFECGRVDYIITKWADVESGQKLLARENGRLNWLIYFPNANVLLREESGKETHRYDIQGCAQE